MAAIVQTQPFRFRGAFERSPGERLLSSITTHPKSIVQFYTPLVCHRIRTVVHSNAMADTEANVQYVICSYYSAAFVDYVGPEGKLSMSCYG